MNAFWTSQILSISSNLVSYLLLLLLTLSLSMNEQLRGRISAQKQTDITAAKCLRAPTENLSISSIITSSDVNLLTYLLFSKMDIDATGTFETYEILWSNLSSTSHLRPLLLLLLLSMRWWGLDIEVTMYTVFYWITASFFKCCFCWRKCLILSLNPISNPMTVFICSSLFGTSFLACNKCPPRKRHLRMCLFTASSGKYFCVFLFAIRSW